MTNLQVVNNMVQNDFVQMDRAEVAWEADIGNRMGRGRGVEVVEVVV